MLRRCCWLQEPARSATVGRRWRASSQPLSRGRTARDGHRARASRTRKALRPGRDDRSTRSRSDRTERGVRARNHSRASGNFDLDASGRATSTAERSRWAIRWDVPGRGSSPPWSTRWSAATFASDSQRCVSGSARGSPRSSSASSAGTDRSPGRGARPYRRSRALIPLARLVPHIAGRSARWGDRRGSRRDRRACVDERGRGGPAVGHRDRDPRWSRSAAGRASSAASTRRRDRR